MPPASACVIRPLPRTSWYQEHGRLFPPAINMVTAQRLANVRHLWLMAKWKQYELWVQSAQNKWEIVGLFPSTELATVVANARTARTRLIEVVYDGSKMMGQEIIAELGTTRKE